MARKLAMCKLNTGNVIKDAFPWLWKIRFNYSLTTPQAIAREAWRILYKKLSSALNKPITTYDINHQSKRRGTIKIRMPNKFTVRENETI